MKKMKRQKPVIVLDVGGVLVDFNLHDLLEKLSRRFGMEIKAPLPVDLDALFLPLQTGKRSWEAIPPVLNKSLGISIEPEEWLELWCHIFTGEVLGMREVLFELKNSFSLVALSNTIEGHWTFLLRKYPIFELLDGWVVSYSVGAVKPHPDIYQAVVDRYCGGRPPFFYTDDTPQYVDAARRLGWESEVFRNSAQLLEEVQKRRPSA